jgi:hypothetical protein
MTYVKFPPNTKMSNDFFISEMNKAITSLPFFQQGMVVCFDENGYWLELNGIRDSENLDMLSAAHKLVLGI